MAGSSYGYLACVGLSENVISDISGLLSEMQYISSMGVASALLVWRK